jgi:hypothetical protein
MNFFSNEFHELPVRERNGGLITWSRSWDETKFWAMRITLIFLQTTLIEISAFILSLEILNGLKFC